MSLNPEAYMGSASHTADGNPCDRWNQTDGDMYSILSRAMPDLPEWNVMETNFCRLPVSPGAIWSKLNLPDSPAGPWCLVDGIAHLCNIERSCGKIKERTQVVGTSRKLQLL